MIKISSRPMCLKVRSLFWDRTKKSMTCEIWLLHSLNTLNFIEYSCCVHPTPHLPANLSIFPVGNFICLCSWLSLPIWKYIPPGPLTTNDVSYPRPRFGRNCIANILTSTKLYVINTISALPRHGVKETKQKAWNN